MEKTLTFKADGKEYKLGFTRETIMTTEDMGFNLIEAYEKPIKSLTLLWRGAFLEHHPTLDNSEIDALFEKINKAELLATLIDLYKAPVDSLFGEKYEKNAIKWTVN